MLSSPVLLFAACAAAAVAGLIVGWVLRARRAALEKKAINAGWQHQIDAQQAQNERVSARNTSLTEQLNQQQAQASAARGKVSQVERDLAQARADHDALQAEIREIRGNLEQALVQRDRLRSNVQSKNVHEETISAALRRKDEKIARLKLELGRWQERVPPLVERYRARDLEAQQLEIELERANSRIAELESSYADDETHVEPIQRPPIENLDASNEQYGEGDDERAAPAAIGGPPADDLQRIKGIGPAIEKTLNRLGIHRFSQIAGISDYDIDRVAAELRGFRTRIHREDWIGQARLLLHESGSDPAPR